MKKKLFVVLLFVLALMVTADTYEEVVKINIRKTEPIEVTVATYLSIMKDDGKVYLVIQRLGSDGKEIWEISQKILNKLVEYKRYEFKIQGYPGGYIVLGATLITTD